MSVGIYFISSKINKLSDAVAKKQSDISSFAQQHISGIRVLKSYAREAKSARRFEQESDEYKSHVLKLVKVEALFMPLIILLVGLSTVLTVYIGGLRVMEGHLELGHIFQFIFYVNLLTWPFASVGWVTSLVQKAEASMARILHFLETESKIVSESSVKPGEENNFEAHYKPSSGLVFKDVGFTYPETGIIALEGLNFTLEAGTTVAITGRTGSGKSTILQLVMRMMDPTEGSISFKGAELGLWNLEKYREHTGYVPQDVFLFSDTIENNISFGVKAFKSQEREKKRITESALDAGVLEDINGFEHGFKTLLGERGVNLSGGQKQRISIARALIRAPELLILDDCLSAVDVITEKHILGRLKESNNTRSTLVVSHRISTIKDADLILVIEAGHIVERGTHQELIKTGGLYAEMDQKQEGS
tara:strand:- start:210 stop:1469 length:1260 start_codon:yes stop_codon:yes gene_type:complete